MSAVVPEALDADDVAVLAMVFLSPVEGGGRGAWEQGAAHVVVSVSERLPAAAGSEAKVEEGARGWFQGVVLEAPEVGPPQRVPRFKVMTRWLCSGCASGRSCVSRRRGVVHVGPCGACLAC